MGRPFTASVIPTAKLFYLADAGVAQDPSVSRSSGMALRWQHRKINDRAIIHAAGASSAWPPGPIFVSNAALTSASSARMLRPLGTEAQGPV